MHSFTALASSLLFALASAQLNIPAGCPLLNFTLNELTWFNGSHSLDCVNHRPQGNSACYGCGDWCDPSRCEELGGHPIDPCLTGLPNYQPWGYGPTEQLRLVWADGLVCADQYIGYRIHDPGNGESQCGYANRAMGQIIAFYGSVDASVSKAHIDYDQGGEQLATPCADGSKISYSGTQEFDLYCAYDEQKNATCTIKSPVVITPNKFRTWNATSS